MNRVDTLHEQAAILRKLAESFDAPEKANLVTLAERCDELAKLPPIATSKPPKFSPSA